MAITLADFTKIWASTSPLTPYSFSESNYKEGWNFIGSTPPARQMWDSIQKQNDEKMKYIVDNFVPMTFSTFKVSKTNNMLALAVQQAVRMGNLAIVSFDGQLTSTKGAWTDTDIMTLSVTTSGTTYCIGLTNNGTSVLLQVANNKVTYRTLSHAVNDDTIRGLLVFPVSG